MPCEALQHASDRPTKRPEQAEDFGCGGEQVKGKGKAAAPTPMNERTRKGDVEGRRVTGRGEEVGASPCINRTNRYYGLVDWGKSNWAIVLFVAATVGRPFTL